MQIEVSGLRKHYGHFEACKDVSFRIGQGNLIGLLGPSGGGKTTILRLLAGLEIPDSGEIRFAGQRVNEVPPQKRGIGFVFQNYALFKHMTVFENIAFGLHIQKVKKSDIRERVLELVALTGLQGMERRYPHQLSGGQRQRVAFARALAPKPQLLLLDEPFAAIDAKVRKELRSWLKEMISRVGVTTIFVTHDQDEAVEVADEIIIVHQGRLEQVGTPIEIYNRPASAFVAHFIGESNVVHRPSELKGFAGVPEEAQAIVRPEFIDVGRGRELATPSAAEKGVVKQVYFRGSSWLVEAEVGSQALFAYRSLESPPLHPGDEVLVLIHRLYLFADNRMQTIENEHRYDPMPVHI
ncbi:ABC transporter ATP-binding protein [Paenibacillus sp. J2TS4]|uniref:ABC transporter ATP-binding protein n=1 Tax=Paenibacillus sp. J2TS4 TaxID=2807194 RepID=UPI001B233983|nr:ABC transporter ATP-binding protein [Paenibacillus sp. J2TS4]GIP35207.1 sulfate/thiosulfate import ATP-binding protein CysA [Paenibacillus sp. J2TS4]